MVNEIQYISIKDLLSNIMLHPMLQDVTLEQAVIYTLRFIGLHGFPKMYQDKIDTVEIHDFRGLLPCDLIRIDQVRDCASGICLRSMTDTLPMGLKIEGEKRRGVSLHHKPKHVDLMNNVREQRKMKDWYIPPRRGHLEEPSFKTQGRVIYTSFPEGVIELAYKAIRVDEDGFPMLIDNEVFKSALEQFIKQEVFTYKFDQGKISAQVLQNAQQQYAWRAGQLQSEFQLPSLSELESISRMLTTLVPNVRSFDRHFRDEGDREWIRRH